MAQGFPSVILESVLKQLKSPIFWRNKLHIRLHIQLQELQSQLQIIKDVTDEAELMGVLFPDHAVGKRVCELQNLLYEVDDLFAEVLARSTPAYGMVEKVRLHLYNLSFPLTLAPEIKKINRRLDGIVKEFCKCNLILTTPVGEHDKLVARKGIPRYDPRYVSDDEFQMMGRDDDKKKVIKMLLNKRSREKFVGIHGDAGVGKTTLCRAVYNDEAVRRHFEIRLWVGGLIEYSSIELWKKIATELGVDWQSYGSDTDLLREKIASIINGRKFLIILDSVPIHYIDQDPKLRALIVNGSKTLTTASSIKTPDIIRFFILRRRALQHRVGDKLSEEQMWSLFEKTAFDSSYRRTQWMIDLGKDIARRCPGNPALLKGVATLLCGERDMNVWQKFAREFDFETQYRRYDEFREVFEVAPKCQQNVGYLSLFSTVEFKFDDLIHQFAAHRFTPLSNTAREELKRNHFRRLSTDADGTYAVGVGYRDSITRLAGAESNMVGCGDNTDVHQVAGRHVSISSSSVQQQNGKLPDGLLKEATHRRSLLLFGDDSVPAVIRVQTLSVLFSHLRNLRVLSLQDLRLRVLPNSIGRLIHLKYLDLSGNNFVELPASVCTLALWTLKLTYCSELKSFPLQITNLRTLKHLEIDMCFDLIYMPSRIAQLTGLESLDRFVVSSRKGGLRYLENLNKLNGHLSIELPRRWKKYAEDIKQANLRGKTALASLEFKWHGAHNDSDGNDYDVLEQLEPCTSIEKVSLLNYGGTKLPGWFTSLGFLTEISLCRCARFQDIHTLQSMPKLKCLTLVSLHHMMEYIVNDEGNDGVSPDVFFPSLRVLKIGRMPELKRWSRDMDGLSRFPDIETLEIWDCPSLIHMPLFPSMPMLKCLTLVSLDHIEYILQNDKGNDGASPDDVFFPSLRVLKIGRMPVLKGWSREMDGLSKFSGIETLEIWDCPSLVHMPPFSRICHTLKLKSVSEKALVIESTQIKELQITSIPNMVSLPDQFIPMHPTLPGKGLWYLSIANCHELKHLSSSFTHLLYLRDLEITRCSEELDCLNAEEEDRMPWRTLQHLNRLRVEGFENLVALPKALQHLPSLNKLEIIDCKRLERGLNSLKNLENLAIKSCPLFSRSIEEFKTENRNVKVVVE